MAESKAPNRPRKEKLVKPSVGDVPTSDTTKAIRLRRPSKETSSLAARWTSMVVAPGWTAIPNMLLYHQADLRLSDGEVVTLLNMLSHWREKNRQPFVAKKTIATRMGKDERTVQTHYKKLCTERTVIGIVEPVVLVTRHPRYRDRREIASSFSFEGLIEVLTHYAKAEQARRQPR